MRRLINRLDGDAVRRRRRRWQFRRKSERKLSVEMSRQKSVWMIHIERQFAFRSRLASQRNFICSAVLGSANSVRGRRQWWNLYPRSTIKECFMMFAVLGSVDAINPTANNRSAPATCRFSGSFVCSRLKVKSIKSTEIKIRTKTALQHSHATVADETLHGRFLSLGSR